VASTFPENALALEVVGLLQLFDHGVARQPHVGEEAIVDMVEPAEGAALDQPVGEALVIANGHGRTPFRRRPMRPGCCDANLKCCPAFFDRRCRILARKPPRRYRKDRKVLFEFEKWISAGTT
jgi:hypothetical protein